jgi:hypothetical protein
VARAELARRAPAPQASPPIQPSRSFSRLSLAALITGAVFWAALVVAVLVARSSVGDIAFWLLLIAPAVGFAVLVLAALGSARTVWTVIAFVMALPCIALGLWMLVGLGQMD